MGPGWCDTVGLPALFEFADLRRERLICLLLILPCERTRARNDPAWKHLDLVSNTIYLFFWKTRACSSLLKYVFPYCKDIALPRMLSLLHIPILLSSPGKLYNIYFCKVVFPISIPLSILLLSRRKLSRVLLCHLKGGLRVCLVIISSPWTGVNLNPEKPSFYYLLHFGESVLNKRSI